MGEGTITISATQTYGSVSSSPVTAQVTVAALPAPTTAITVDAGFTGDTLVNGVGDGVVSGNETPTFKGAATTNASVSVVVTNTIPLTAEAAACSKIRQLSVAPLIAETIHRIAHGESVMSLFSDQA